MLDAVREAARTVGTVSVESIQSYLEGRAAHPEAVDVQNFMSLVQQQQMNDLVDVIDGKLRGGLLKSARGKIRLSASGGQLRKLVASLDEASLAQVFHRLEAMGHSANKIDDFFKPGIAPEVHQAARAATPPVPGKTRPQK